ncbi:MAG: NAD(P)(+) transhydrogenase (Re/Si-specific) subunit beta, partial [Bacteroidales bacterium]|nr:NAD(P)(+) transhydrogenase (Re/Si-specific) subunit beta [Bacteroidales bacterium]
MRPRRGNLPRSMPVIISLLNAFSGLAAAFAGLAIRNSVLVVSG